MNGMRTTIELKPEHRAKLLELAARRGEKGFTPMGVPFGPIPTQPIPPNASTATLIPLEEIRALPREVIRR